MGAPRITRSDVVSADAASAPDGSQSAGSPQRAILDLVKRSVTRRGGGPWHRSPKPDEQVAVPRRSARSGHLVHGPQARRPGHFGDHPATARASGGWPGGWTTTATNGPRRSTAKPRPSNTSPSVPLQLSYRHLRRSRPGGSHLRHRRTNRGSTPRADSSPRPAPGTAPCSMSSCCPGGRTRRCATSPTPTFRHGYTPCPPTPWHASARPSTTTTTTRKGLSAARVMQAYQVVDQVLRYAVRSRYIAVNPAEDVQLPRKTTPEKFALTHDQVRAACRRRRRSSDDCLRPGLRWSALWRAGRTARG